VCCALLLLADAWVVAFILGGHVCFECFVFCEVMFVAACRHGHVLRN
jgi:hypothetical protein